MIFFYFECVFYLKFHFSFNKCVNCNIKILIDHKLVLIKTVFSFQTIKICQVLLYNHIGCILAFASKTHFQTGDLLYKRKMIIKKSYLTTFKIILFYIMKFKKKTTKLYIFIKIIYGSGLIPCHKKHNMIFVRILSNNTFTLKKRVWKRLVTSVFKSRRG